MVNGIKALYIQLFVNAIDRGFGWIDPDDVSRQWDGMFGVPPTEGGLKEILARLEADGLLREDE